ncbi:triosephosphate isomerase (TIM) [Catalinimonas alkaloidigena]|uniref:Triosephosphate isomerase n=1 Tax=Catalinimonas alkaloidigena TaxID=1075417 RepID=A0A1G9DXW7_9BACT|nr:triose-phosphate isomerase [Catalinimonas alkaloidigena]SDK68688.1 triosephosphate isomerase (TIM) [Catalinimonas alkaloidigena]
MRQKIVAGNWKMNKDAESAQSLASEVVNMVKDEVTSEVTVVMAPPFPFLSSTQRQIGDAAQVFLGAQNCYPKDSGAYTGEVSVPMLKSVGVTYVILGHSERREYFGEKDATIADKVDAVLAGGLVPIYCCGESLETREANDHEAFVSGQLDRELFHLDAEAIKKVVIAYEPIWAIGTGKTASPEQAQEMHATLRNHLAKKYGSEVANAISILYGGSVKPDNAAEIFAKPDVDGGLIGGASLKSRDFLEIVKAL